MVPSVYSRDAKLIQCCGPHLHTWILYGPDPVEKNFEQARLYINGPQNFLSAGTGNQFINFAAHQPRKSIPIDGEWHYLEIATSPGNGLRKSCDVA